MELHTFMMASYHHIFILYWNVLTKYNGWSLYCLEKKSVAVISAGFLLVTLFLVILSVSPIDSYTVDHYITDLSLPSSVIYKHLLFGYNAINASKYPCLFKNRINLLFHFDIIHQPVLSLLVLFNLSDTFLYIPINRHLYSLSADSIENAVLS